MRMLIRTINDPAVIAAAVLLGIVSSMIDGRRGVLVFVSAVVFCV